MSIINCAFSRVTLYYFFVLSLLFRACIYFHVLIRALVPTDRYKLMRLLNTVVIDQCEKVGQKSLLRAGIW